MPRKPSFGIRAASIALLSIQAAPVQAIERSKVEPIASETIDIIVSVRARYQLRAADEPRSPHDQDSHPAKLDGRTTRGNPRHAR